MTNVASYRWFNTKHFKWIVAIIVVLLIACKNENQTHHDHQVEMTGMTNDDSIQHETYWLSLPTNQTVVARQQVIKPVITDTLYSTVANGYITFDARRNHKVAVRVGGRIERLYVKYNYQFVHRGEKILELYSPELNTYLEEYLYLRKNTSDSLLQNRAKEKLLLLGITPSQVKEVEKSKNVPSAISIYSPVEGYVLFNPSGSNASMETKTNSRGEMSMDGGTNTLPSIQASSLSDNSVREGMYVSKDQTLFWINDFKQVWGILAFNQQAEKYVKKGQVAVVQSELFPGQPFRSVIQFTEPAYQQGQKFTQARIYISNDKGIFKQNSLIKATMASPGRSMTLPASSVMYLGQVAIVWVQTDTTKQGSNVFQSRVVQVGRQTGDLIEILGGLQPLEAVAKDASYLADSETIIQY